MTEVAPAQNQLVYQDSNINPRPQVQSDAQPIRQDMFFYFDGFRKYRLAADQYGWTPENFFAGHQTLMKATGLPDDAAWELYQKENFFLEAAYQVCDKFVNDIARTTVEQLHTLAQEFKIQDYEQLTFAEAEQLAVSTLRSTSWDLDCFWQLFKIEAIRRLVNISNVIMIKSVLLFANGETVLAIDYLQNMIYQFQKSNNIYSPEEAHKYLNKYAFDIETARTQYRSDLVSEFTEDFGITDAKALGFLENAEWDFDLATTNFRASLLEALIRKGNIQTDPQLYRLRRLLEESEYNLSEYRKLFAQEIAIEFGWSTRAAYALIDRHDYDIPAMIREFKDTPFSISNLV
jgi:hypothetical protein